MQNLSEKIKIAQLGKTHLFFVGQAGFIIKNKQGCLLGIDLYLSNCVEIIEGHIGFHRLQPQIMEPNEVNFDILIATHNHLDHYDKDAIPQLMSNGKTKLLASKCCKSLIEESYIDTARVDYVSPRDTLMLSGFKIHFVNCDHGKEAPEAVGVIVETDDKVICETGDTCLRTDRIGELLKYGNHDVLIAPINGNNGNMNEIECIKLCRSLRPKIVIPCHYGMFASHGGDIKLFYDIANKELPEQKLCLMAPGEGIII